MLSFFSHSSPTYIRIVEVTGSNPVCSTNKPFTSLKVNGIFYAVKLYVLYKNPVLTSCLYSSLHKLLHKTLHKIIFPSIIYACKMFCTNRCT